MSPAPSPNVIVIGSVNVDLTLRLPSLPGPGETVTGGTVLRALGGKGANQAVAAARLGARTALVGRVGNDADGGFVRAELASHGVDVDQLVADPDRPTGLAAVLTAGENLIGVASGANAALTAADVRAALRAKDLSAAVLVANLEVPIEAVLAASELAREWGRPFVLNPAPAQPLPMELLRRVDLLTPNQHEWRGLDLIGFGGTMLVTRGSDGVDLIENGAAPQHIDAFEVAAVDSAGAGDAFTGALAWALADGLAGTTIHAAAVYAAAVHAAAAGALATRAVGAQAALPTAAELQALLDSSQRL